MRAAVERRAAHVRRGLAGNADLEEHLALRGALAHEVAAVVGAVQDVVRVDMQAVRTRKGALAPGAQEVSVAVEHDHRVLAAVERIDAVLAVHRHRGDVLELPALGQLAPAFDHPVPIVAAA